MAGSSHQDNSTSTRLTSHRHRNGRANPNFAARLDVIRLPIDIQRRHHSRQQLTDLFEALDKPGGAAARGMTPHSSHQRQAYSERRSPCPRSARTSAKRFDAVWSTGPPSAQRSSDRCFNRFETRRLGANR